MRKTNQLKQRLTQGEFVLGTWSVLPSPAVANVVGAAGFDFLIIDMEHGPISFEIAENVVRAAEGENCTPLIRVPANEEWLILRGLEIGSHGVVVPQITSAEEAQSAISAIKYSPEGHRGFSPYTRSGGYTSLNASGLAAQENINTLSVLLVEGKKGISNLDAILEVPNLDVIYLGTYDLSQSVGYPGQPDHPIVLGFVEECVQRIQKRGIAVGCLAESQMDVTRWRQLGIQFIAYQADCSLLYHACLEVAQRFND